MRLLSAVLFFSCTVVGVRTFSVPRISTRRAARVQMVLSPDTREILKNAKSSRPERSWAVHSATVDDDVIASLEKALKGARDELGEDGTVTVVRIARGVESGFDDDEDAQIDAVVRHARDALGGTKHIVGIMIQRRSDDEDLVSVSLGRLPEEDVQVFHLNDNSAIRSPLHFDLYNENAHHFILYPQEDFSVGSFMNRVYATNPEAQQLGEPVWNGDVTFMYNPVYDGEETLSVRKYRAGMMGIKVPAVVELQKQWPWWQQSLAAMLSWCDR